MNRHQTRLLSRRDFLRRVAGVSSLAGLFPVKTLFAAAPPSKDAVTQAPYYWSWWGWEPLAHYRRAGGIVGAVDTQSPTLEQWFDRLHS
ncbi:MAG: twin-arginine translocation signal domain-containing protein, partial [Verrucomicrobiae bacterium]|nr:twin-arginine translocation signal domain-containing protein [Verrucomicrobiae bacterium]